MVEDGGEGIYIGWRWGGGVLCCIELLAPSPAPPCPKRNVQPFGQPTFFMSNQLGLGFALRYVTIFGAGVTSLLAGASSVHYFLAPDLTLPPPPADLQARARELGVDTTSNPSTQ